MINSILFKPNPEFISTVKSAIPIRKLFKTKFLTMSYISVWLMFCINISCGLAIISQEKSLLLNLKYTEIAFLLSITALMNIFGRIGFSTLSDKIGRKAVYHFVCTFGILAALFCFTQNPVLSLFRHIHLRTCISGQISHVYHLCLANILEKNLCQPFMLSL